MGGRSKGTITGIVLSLLGIAIALLLTPTGQSLQNYALNPGSQPTCSQPRWLLQVPDSQILASAWYEHPPYTANQTVDDNTDTEAYSKLSLKKYSPTAAL